MCRKSVGQSVGDRAKDGGGGIVPLCCEGVSDSSLIGASEALFEGGEELAGLGEGFDELHLVVEVAVEA